MAAEEDKKFDAVLGGFLVNDLRARAGHLHCPESDTLAAYHERSLLPEEMNSWKEHIVGCARCQAILAELEAADSIPLDVSAIDKLPLADPTAPLDVASKHAAAAPVRVLKKPRVTSISRGLRWVWLAPAGALAAGLLVWVAWRENENRMPLVKPPAEATTARVEPLAPLPPSVLRDDRQSASTDEVARLSKDQDAVGGAAATKPAPDAKTLKQFEEAESHGRLTRSESSADKEIGARADAALDSSSPAALAQNQRVQDGKAGVAGAAPQAVEVQTMTANGQTQNQQVQQNLQVEQNQLNEPKKISGPNPSRHMEKAKKNKSEVPMVTYQDAAPPPAAPTPTAAFEENVRAPSTLMAGGLVQHLIVAPGAKTLWRVGHLGMIEFSNDGGAHWSRQLSNISVELTVGWAPSDKVCWIVGQAGTILLTTDAGAHWATVHSPLAEDLGAVRATDALHATISNLAKTKLYETSDGGLTWKPAASP